MIRLFIVLSLFVGLLSESAPAGTYETIYKFPSDPTGFMGSAGLMSPLVFDPSGTAIYLMRGSKKQVFYKLTPPTSTGRWNKTTIFNCPSASPCDPIAGMALDQQGNLYAAFAACDGETVDQCIVEMSPPISGTGKWTGKIISKFGEGSYLNEPEEGLIIDGAGNLYGGGLRDASGSSIYELVKPSSPGGAWTRKRLVTLNDGDGDWLTRGPGGAFFGTGVGNGGTTFGTVWKAMPPANGQGWKFIDLAEFPICDTQCSGGTFPYGIGPAAGIVMDAKGNLYGTASQGGLFGYGTVFEVSKPAAVQAQWTVTVLHSFKGTDGVTPEGLTIDTDGNLYGVAKNGGAGWQAPHQYGGNGVVYKLSPPAISGGSWSFTILHRPTKTFYTVVGVHAINPRLTRGPDGKLYGTANGPDGSGGSVFRITP